MRSPLTLALQQSFEQYANHPALFWDTANASKQLTYQALQEQVAAYARQLITTCRIQPGDRVGVLRYNDLEWVIAYLALLSIGAVVVPLSTRLTALEIAGILHDCEAVGLITDEFAFKSVISGLKTLPSPLGRGQEASCASFAGEGSHSAPSPGPTNHPLPQGEGSFSELAALVYTSGTTGKPKGVMLSHGNLLTDATANNQVLELTEADRLITVSPLFHVFGQVNILLSGLLSGAAIVLLPQFTPQGVLAVLKQHPVTVLTAVPTMYQQMLPFVTRPFASLRVCHSGAAPMPESVLTEVEARFGAPVQEGYGLSEATSIVCSNPLQGTRKPGSVGPAISGVTVRVVDPETGSILLPEAEGELQVSGPIVMQGYYQQPELTRSRLIQGPEGQTWLKTGDCASMDPEGYVRILGRRDDLINVAGVKVYPREIEEVLLRHPAIAGVAVVGEASSVYHQQVVAYAVLKPGHPSPILRELRDFARPHLASYKLPRVLNVVDSLPQSPSGKVLRRLLGESAG